MRYVDDLVPCIWIMDGGPGIRKPFHVDVNVEVVYYDWSIDHEEDDRHDEKLDKSAFG